MPDCNFPGSIEHWFDERTSLCDRFTFQPPDERDGMPSVSAMIRMSGLAEALMPAIDVNTAAGTPTVSRIMVSWSPVTKHLPPSLIFIVSAIPTIGKTAPSQRHFFRAGCCGMRNEPIRLGLIGDNIAASQSPKLHRLAGRKVRRIVSYDQIVPRHLDFEGTFALCVAGCYRGGNVSYPYKELVTAKVRIDDPLVRAMGAVNTEVFEPDGPHGFNTDHSGFMAAYRAALGCRPLRRVLMIGAGGVGKAVAFLLVAPGLTDIAIADRDVAKAEALCGALRRARPGLAVIAGADAEALAPGSEGIINGTPGAWSALTVRPWRASPCAARPGPSMRSIRRLKPGSCAMPPQGDWRSSPAISSSSSRVSMHGASSQSLASMPVSSGQPCRCRSERMAQQTHPSAKRRAHRAPSWPNLAERRAA